MLYGLDAVEKRQNEGKKRVDQLDEHLKNMTKEIDKTNAEIESKLTNK